MKNLLFFILTLSLTFPLLCQVSKIKQHPFSGTLVFSLDGGININKTDYPDTKIGGRIVGGVEYYLPTSSIHIFGVRGFGGGQEVNSKADNKIITIPGEGPVVLPDIIITDMYIAGISLMYSISINDKLFPFLSGGISNLWFNPKTGNGRRAPNNILSMYKKSAIAYDLNFGIKYPVSDNLSIKLESGLHFPNTDYLDDIAAGKNNDFFSSTNIGISYSLKFINDTDGDGITDEFDQCPDEPEDFDGFQDEDGCPDVDNDGDGILDFQDQCPDSPEDFDGFQDEDGCTDIDNDGDGIIDELDQCPDEAEDFDEFQDEDGCPDIDNDGDGILDVDDKCPDIAGTKALIGCPGEDTENNNYLGAPKEIIIESEATFYPNDQVIKPEAIPELDRIVKILELYPEIEWRLESHSDISEGENLMIRPLSLRRAESILNYFVSKGLPSFQFKVYDMGDRFPIANNNTEYGRMKNRRIVIVREN